jgi:hypothetical protein
VGVCVCVGVHVCVHHTHTKHMCMHHTHTPVHMCTSYLLPLTAYLLPLTSYLLPLTSYLLSLNVYLLPLTFYLLPLTSYHLSLTSYLALDVKLRVAKDVAEAGDLHGMVVQCSVVHCMRCDAMWG